MTNYQLMYSKSEELQKLLRENVKFGDKVIHKNNTNFIFLIKTDTEFIFIKEKTGSRIARRDLSDFTFLPSLEWMLEKIEAKTDWVIECYTHRPEFPSKYHMDISLQKNQSPMFDGMVYGNSYKEVALKALVYIMWGKTWNEEEEKWEK